jgi:PhnB protein
VPWTPSRERVFEALADGGRVQMPIQPTFWARAFGMVTDRYGTPWLVNGGPLPT